ncbi:MAG: hypothetical protein Q9164_006960 [Protoblastenia rupestris]
MPKRPREEYPSASTPISAFLESEGLDSEPADTPERSAKYSQFSSSSAPRAVMKCSLPPHTETLSFDSFEDFEIHYAKSHAHRCYECRNNFPTEHFLGLHISENHDPLNEVKRAKGEKINYDFLIVNAGIDKRSSMLQTRHHKNASAAARGTQQGQKSDKTNGSLPQGSRGASPGSSASDPPDSPSSETSAPNSADIDNLTSNMSSLKFVPPSIRFGRGGRRGGFSRS